MNQQQAGNMEVSFVLFNHEYGEQPPLSVAVSGQMRVTLRHLGCW